MPFDPTTARPAFDPATAKPLTASGPQPSFLDRVVASPVGRFAQENVVAPGIALLAGTPFGPDAANVIGQAENSVYQGSLARNRNTPGYAAALANVQSRTAPSSLGSMVTRPFNSTMAGIAGGLLGGSLDSSNAAADTQTAADETYSKAHPILSGAGELLGGLMAGPGHIPLPAKVAPAIPTAEDLGKLATQNYRKAEQAGVVIKKDSWKGLAKDITDTLANEGIDQDLHNNAFAALRRVNGVDENVTLKGAETIRRVAGAAISKAIKTGSGDDVRMGYVIKNKIDDFLSGITPNDVLMGDQKQAIPALQQARSLWNRMSKAEVIDHAIENASTRATTQHGNEAAALRGEFASLARNQKIMQRFNADEQAAIKDVATVGPTRGTLAALGVLRPRGLVGTMELMGGVMDPHQAALPMLGAAGVGQGSQMALNALTRRSARLASELVRAGKSPAALPRVSPLSLPQITAQSRLPAGLFGSGWLLNQQLQPAQ